MNEQENYLSIDEAVNALKSSRSTVYRWLRTGELRGTKVGRQWRITPAEIERFLKGEEPRIASPPGVQEFVEHLRSMSAERGHEIDDGGGETDSPAMAAVTAMIGLAIGAEAGHMAIEPHLSEDGRVTGWFRMRIDGALSTVATLEPRSIPAIVEAWKVWSGCDPHTRGEIQSARCVVGVGEDRTVDLRVTVVPTVLGESVSIGLIDPRRTARLIDLDRLDYAPDDRRRIDDALDAPWGMTVVTGPTDSGKSTSLYAALTELSTPQREIIAIEAVSEWRVPGVMHVPVNRSEGTTFPAAIRASLECDPDVLMVSEIQDGETLELTPTVALTGHLVLTALHAPDTVSALLRMKEFGLQRHTIAEAIRLIVAQRLVRRLCDDCAVEASPGATDLQNARDAAEAGGVTELEDGWRKPVGCSSCSDTGFRGRRVIAETVEMTVALRDAILAGAEADELEAVARADGSSSIRADGIRRAAAGETTLDEVWRVTD